MKPDIPRNDVVCVTTNFNAYTLNGKNLDEVKTILDYEVDTFSKRNAIESARFSVTQHTDGVEIKLQGLRKETDTEYNTRVKNLLAARNKRALRKKTLLESRKRAELNLFRSIAERYDIKIDMEALDEQQQ